MLKLRNKYDKYQVILGFFSFLLIPTVSFYSPSNYFSKTLVWFIVWLLICRNNYVLHNHVHFPFFEKKAENKVLDIVLCCSTGMPAGNWRLMHVHGHHVEHKVDGLRSREITHRFVVPEGRDFSLWEATKYVACNIFLQISYPILRFANWVFMSRFKRWYAAYHLFDYLIMVVFVSIIFYLDTFSGFAILVIYFSVTAISMYIDYLTHCGVTEAGEISFSRMSQDKVFNRFFWNFGHHVGHHMSPKTHWSQLPEFENRIGVEIILESPKSKSLNFFSLFQPLFIQWHGARINEKKDG